MKRVIQASFGFVLLAGASLKAQAIWPGPAVAKRVHWLSASEIVGEWVLSIWMLSGFAMAWASRVAWGLLVIFASVSAWRLAEGKADCGCFGALHVRLGLTLALDVSVLAALLLSGSLGDAGQQSALSRGSAIGPRLTFLALLSTLVPAAIIYGPSLGRNHARGQMVEIKAMRAAPS